MIKRLIGVAYFLEVGLLLVLVPWSAYWERNHFAGLLPFLPDLLRNNFVRGGVSGLGLVNLLIGFHDLAGLVSVRRGLEPDAKPGPASIPGLVNEK